MTTKILDILARDLTQKIEEIVKVYQTDEGSVWSEITEYVATDRIKQQYRELLTAIAEAPSDPNEGVGVWVSGFFGSGKSSFAKNLGYILSNPNVLGTQASELFKNQIKDDRIGELIDFINVKIPTDVVMFDVTVDKAMKRDTQRIADIMYTVLLRELGYAEDYDVAELEIELESEGKLEEFVALCQQEFGQEWSKVRKGAQKIARASALLRKLEPQTYATEDSWAQSIHNRSVDLTVGRFVERAFDLVAVRRPGKALTFIVDEVGQYVARSADKIEDLRALIEQFGKEGKNRLKTGKATAPIWIVVTSQEKLDEVVAAIDSKRIELAKLQDRFKHRVDLSPADIREVATKRVLAKKPESVALLERLYDEHQGQLNAALRLERTQRRSEITRKEFVDFYPYPPHFIDLSISIMSGIRMQPGASKHYGGSSRTIIRQAYVMLVSERTAMADAHIGALVTFDKIFELVEGNLSMEKQTDISDINDYFRDDPEDRGMTVRVAKAISLLEFIRDVPRTETNIAACLVDTVGQSSPLAEVQQAVKKLEQSQFVRNTEEGWKLQTAQEKNWDTERRSIEPRPKDRNELTRDILRGIFDEPQLKKYRFRDLRTFDVGVMVDGVRVSTEGDIALSLLTADDAESLAAKVEEARKESRDHRNELYWTFALTPEIDDLQKNLFASRQMIAKYEQLRAQNRITTEESSLLANEASEANRYRSRLRDKMIEALEQGQGLFQGKSKDAASLGKNVGEIFKKFFDAAVPELFPKLEMGYRPLKGTEAEEFLKAANLNALPPLFHEGDKGLHLVKKEGNRYLPNPTADITKEILDFIIREHSYGNKVSGKALEERFRGIGYGWELDMLRLVLAVLLRAGSIEIIYQGRRLRDYQDAQSRAPLVNTTAFRSSSFAPRESIDLRTLTTAVRYLEELTGEEVEIEEGAIAAAFKKLVDEELRSLLPIIATVQANNLPAANSLEDYRSTLEGVQASASDDCVRTLASDGGAFQESRGQVRLIRKVISDGGVKIAQQARLAASAMATTLIARNGDAGIVSSAEEIKALLGSEDFYQQFGKIKSLTQTLLSAYQTAYGTLHRERAGAYQTAVEEVKGRADWTLVPEEMRDAVIAPLTSRCCTPPDEEFTFADNGLVCRRCDASFKEMESDLTALVTYKGNVIARIQELTTPITQASGERIERIRVASFFTTTLDSKDAVDEAVEQLKEQLHKLIDEGAKIIVE